MRWSLAMLSVLSCGSLYNLWSLQPNVFVPAALQEKRQQAQGLHSTETPAVSIAAPPLRRVFPFFFSPRYVVVQERALSALCDRDLYTITSVWGTTSRCSGPRSLPRLRRSSPISRSCYQGRFCCRSSTIPGCSAAAPAVPAAAAVRGVRSGPWYRCHRS